MCFSTAPWVITSAPADRSVRAALGHQGEHLTLPRGQRGEWVAAAAVREARRHHLRLATFVSASVTTKYAVFSTAAARRCPSGSATSRVTCTGRRLGRAPDRGRGRPESRGDAAGERPQLRQRLAALCERLVDQRPGLLRGPSSSRRATASRSMSSRATPTQVAPLARPRLPGAARLTVGCAPGPDGGAPACSGRLGGEHSMAPSTERGPS